MCLSNATCTTASGCVAEAAAATLWCGGGGCSCILRVALRPCLVVPGSGSSNQHALAYFDLENCDVVDVLPSVGLYTLNAVEAHSLQAPGFNP
jgi:hypothetical protein